MKRYLSLVISLALVYFIGFGSAAITLGALPDWYFYLIRPALTPPAWVFPVVWTTLYTFMGIAAWRVFELRKQKKSAVLALWLYVLHLLVNGSWSLIFFGLHALALSSFVILLLLALVLVLSVWFWCIDRQAGLFMLPYLLWVGFATYLNLAIFLFN